MLGIPAIVIFIYMLGETEHSDFWEHNYTVANAVAFANYILTIAFVIYAVRKIGEGYYRAYEKQQNPKIMSEVVKFLWYDFIVLFFILFAIWTFAWDIVMLTWTTDENEFCEEEFDGLITATEFMAGWHMTMLFVGMFFFILALWLLSCAENSLAKPFVSCFVCGFDNIEKEKNRRRQIALEKNQNNKHDEPNNQNGYNQTPQNQYNQPPQDQYNQAPPPSQYNNSYPQPQPPQQQQYQNTNQAHGNQGYDPNGPPMANNNNHNNNENKGFFDKAKDKVKNLMK